MSGIKFNHVFAVLLLLCVVSAFIIPRKTSGVRAHVQGIFYPVAKPARMIASSLRGRMDRMDDKRPVNEVAAENERLRGTVASLMAQVEHLASRVAEGEKFGDPGKDAKRVAVMGNDPQSRDSLSVVGRFDATLFNQPALYNYGLAGRFERAGLTGAQVRLITDRSFSVTGRFATFVDHGHGNVEWREIETPPPLVEGAGNGVMTIKNIEYKDAVEQAKIVPGTWVVVADKDYLPTLQNQRLGRVVSVKRQPHAPQWADIEVQPEWNLMALTQVWVMTQPDAQRSTISQAR